GLHHGTVTSALNVAATGLAHPHPRTLVTLTTDPTPHAPRAAGGYNGAMSIMTERDRAAVRKEFERLTGPVKLVVFSQELQAGDLCRQNESLVREVAELSDQIAVEVLNLAIDRERVQAYGVEQVPAIVVEGAWVYGILFYVVPLGYVIINLIYAILL